MAHEITRTRDCPRTLRDWADVALRTGWRLQRTRAHVAFLTPDGETRVIVSTTPSDHRTRRNEAAMLRRLGLSI